MSVREVFLETAAAVRSLLASPETAVHWSEPSALIGYSVGGLAAHTGRAALTVDGYLDAEVPEEAEPIGAAAYFARIDHDPALPFHAAVRQRGEELAAGGPEAVLQRYDAALTRLRPRLPAEPVDRLIAVIGGTVMRLDEYLVTRIVELAVHADDLTLSVETELPELPPAAYTLTIETLVETARLRHGDLAVLRALTRRERDAANALRVL